MSEQRGSSIHKNKDTDTNIAISWKGKESDALIPIIKCQHPCAKSGSFSTCGPKKQYETKKGSLK